MKWSPKEYYNATCFEVWEAQEGYYDELEVWQHYLRRTAYIARTAMAEEMPEPSEAWPIGEEANEIETDEQYMARREAILQNELRKERERKTLLQDK